MALHNEEQYKQLTEFEKQMQASHWAMMFLLSEVTAGFQILVEKLSAKGALTEQDQKDMDKSLMDTEVMQRGYMQMQKAFQEKYNRIRFAADNPEKVTEYVNAKKAGNDPIDPLAKHRQATQFQTTGGSTVSLDTFKNTETDPGDNGPIMKTKTGELT